MTAQDKWSKWLLETRFGGNAKLAELFAGRLGAVRDGVLKYARIKEGETVLDVGCGDGLIAFGALDRVGETGRVVFSDISPPLLEHCERLATATGARDRCEFVEASADRLRAIGDASVDVVTTRSVLIYVADKPRAFREFFRVLKPGGRVSLFEPINRFSACSTPSSEFWGVGVGPVRDLANRVRAVFEKTNPSDSPMMDFDERDLVRLAEDAGFARVELRLDITAGRRSPAEAQAVSWEVLANAPPNPLAPSLSGAMKQVLTPDEQHRLTEQMRTEVEAGRVTERAAVAYLQATKE